MVIVSGGVARAVPPARPGGGGARPHRAPASCGGQRPQPGLDVRHGAGRFGHFRAAHRVQRVASRIRAVRGLGAARFRVRHGHLPGVGTDHPDHPDQGHRPARTAPHAAPRSLPGRARCGTWRRDGRRWVGGVRSGGWCGAWRSPFWEGEACSSWASLSASRSWRPPRAGTELCSPRSAAGVAIGMVVLAGLGKGLLHREPVFALGLWAAGGRDHLHQLFPVGVLGGGLGADAGNRYGDGLRGRFHPAPHGGDRRDPGSDLRRPLHARPPGAPAVADRGGRSPRWPWRACCPACWATASGRCCSSAGWPC